MKPAIFYTNVLQWVMKITFALSLFLAPVHVCDGAQQYVARTEIVTPSRISGRTTVSLWRFFTTKPVAIFCDALAIRKFALQQLDRTLDARFKLYSKRVSTLQLKGKRSQQNYPDDSHAFDPDHLKG